MSLAVAIEILRAVNLAADVFPPLKSVSGGALFIAESVEKFKRSQEDWKAFADHIQIHVAIIMDHIPKDGSKKKDQWTKNLDTLNLELSKIKKKIEDLQSLKGFKKLRTHLSGEGDIKNLQSDFDRAAQIFQFRSIVTSRSELLERLGESSAEGVVERLLKVFKEEIVSEIDWTAALARLPDPVGTSWTPARACLPGTRAAHLSEISSWISSVPNESSGTAEIFLVADALGSGKTTLAHAVCERAHEAGHLVASFFFNRLDTDRTTSQNLFGAIIRGLCDLTREAKAFIAKRLDANNTLATASPTLQLKELILPVCHHLPKNRPLVIVIDALDEGYDQELLFLLRDSVPLLPSTFRLVITSRPEERIMSFMDQSHIRRSLSFLSGIGNRDDIERYIDAKLRQTSWGSNVSAKLKDDFVEKTQGLFLWAATVFNHLDKSFKPISELQSLIENSSGYWRQGKDSEQKLDNLYHQILSNFEWTDPEFEHVYRTVMGALVTLKEPMSVNGLSSLCAEKGISSEDITQICTRMQSFLAGFDMNSPHRPVHLLHLSVQEYLTSRAPSLYRLDVNKYHGILASCCLEIIDKELIDDNVRQLGYMDEEWDDNHIPWIPKVERASISEQLWYACCFFADHILLVTPENMSPSLARMLQKSLSEKTRQLLEITTSMGKVTDLDALRKWTLLNTTTSSNEIDFNETMDENLSVYLRRLSGILGKSGRTEEALHAIGYVVETNRHLSESQPDIMKNRRLADSLHSLSVCLASLGRISDALITIEEAIQLRRRFGAVQPAQLVAELARSLNSLSVYLGKLDRHAEALMAIEEAVEIDHRFAVHQPTSFEPFLAISLTTLSNCLADLGWHKDALTAIEESIVIRRRLVAEQPDEFEPKLALSLNNLSNRLSRLGRHADALVAIEESVEIHRRLANFQPAAFEADLANSLHNLSINLLSLKHQEEALNTAREAADIFHRLAAIRPHRYNVDLAGTLRLLAYHLVTLGQQEEASKIIQEADAISS